MADVAPAKVLASLKKIAPNISIATTWEEDPNFIWDGDGPDPANRGYIAYDVDVKALAIVDGELVEGMASLGGTYEKHGSRDPNIHGYFAQMLAEALDELEGQVSGPLKKQVNAGQELMKKVMSQNYAAQRSRR